METHHLGFQKQKSYQVVSHTRLMLLGFSVSAVMTWYVCNLNLVTAVHTFRFPTEWKGIKYYESGQKIFYRCRILNITCCSFEESCKVSLYFIVFPIPATHVSLESVLVNYRKCVNSLTDFVAVYLFREMIHY